MRNKELEILNRIQILEARDAANGSIIRKLKRKLRALKTSF